MFLTEKYIVLFLYAGVQFYKQVDTDITEV